jgi:hypothetical protein
MDKTFEHDPGSPKAIAQGCTCPPQNGPGAATGHDGTPAFACDWRCPMHGLEVLQSALEAGHAKLIRHDGDDEPIIH